MKPVAQITANGEDISGLTSDRLVSLSITDDSGKDEADRLTIELDDRDYRIELPEEGAELELALGFEGAELVNMGRWVADKVSGTGPVTTLTIEATSADMTSAMRAPQTRAWPAGPLATIVETIAADHGLRPAVDQALGAIQLDYQAQTAESDLHLLQRLAKRFDAICKPADRALVFVPADDPTAPVIELPLHRLQRWSWTANGRARWGAIEAVYWDAATATEQVETAGTETPVRRLRHRFETQSAAAAAADAALAKSSRAGGTLSMTCAGFEPDLYAGGRVICQGVKPELAGVWTITRVEHALSSALQTTFEAERDLTTE